MTVNIKSGSTRWTEFASKLSIVRQAFGAASSAAGQFFEMGKEGAAFSDQLAARQRMRIDVAQRLEEAGAATKGTLADKDLLSALSRFKGFGLDMDKFAESLELASKASIMTGKSVDEMVDKLVTGLVRQSPKLLDDLMIKGVQVSDINERAARTFGKSRDALTESEKAATLHTVALEKLRKVTAGVSIANDSQAASFKRVEVAAANFLNTLGQGISSVLSNALEQWAYAAEEIAKMMPGGGASPPQEFDAQARRLKGAPAQGRKALLKKMGQEYYLAELDKMSWSDQVFGGADLKRRIDQEWAARAFALQEALAGNDRPGNLQKNIEKLKAGMPSAAMILPSEDGGVGGGGGSTRSAATGPRSASLGDWQGMHAAERARKYAEALRGVVGLEREQLQIQHQLEEVKAKHADTVARLADEYFTNAIDADVMEVEGAKARAEMMTAEIELMEKQIDVTKRLAEAESERDAERFREAMSIAAEGFDMAAESESRALAAVGRMGQQMTQDLDLLTSGTDDAIAAIGRIGAAAIDDTVARAAVLSVFYIAQGIVAMVDGAYEKGAGYLTAGAMMAATAGMSASTKAQAYGTASDRRRSQSLSAAGGGLGAGGTTVINVNAPVIGGGKQSIGAQLQDFVEEGRASGMGGAV